MRRGEGSNTQKKGKNINDRRVFRKQTQLGFGLANYYYYSSTINVPPPPK